MGQKALMAESQLAAGWRAELQEILRGAAGGFLFGIPLLYTVEVWSIGSSVSPLLLLGVLGVTFAVVLLLTQIEGFRRTLELHPLEAVMESIEALGIGLACAAFALVLLQRITLETPLSEMLGKLIFEGVPFSLGVALAQSILNRDRLRDRNRRQVVRPTNSLLALPRRLSPPILRNLRDTLIDLDAALLGALLIAFSIAPTEEVALLAASIPPLWLIAIMAASLVLSYVIVFVSGFRDRAQSNNGVILSPLTETLVAYLVALLASTIMLVFFQQLSFADPWQEWLSDTIVLGLPAAIGGTAGRLLI